VDLQRGGVRNAKADNLYGGRNSRKSGGGPLERKTKTKDTRNNIRVDIFRGNRKFLGKKTEESGIAELLIMLYSVTGHLNQSKKIS